jgi:transketolase
MTASTVDIGLLQQKAVETRLAVLDQVEVAGSGHYGPAFSCTEILVALYYGYLRLRPDDPQWVERDRFVMGKGHAISALYPVLADLGYFDRADLDTFCRLGSRLGDHPDMKKVRGADFSSGSLGHGLSIGAGMAMGARIRGFDSRVVVLLGDGEQNEGQVWEAVQFAAHQRLGSLMAIVDVNTVSVDGATRDVLDLEPLDDRWRAFGWHVERLDGHDLRALREAYERFDERRAAPDARPTVLLADTVVGRGVDFIEGMAEWHVGYFGGVDAERARSSIRRMFDPAASGPTPTEGA